VTARADAGGPACADASAASADRSTRARVRDGIDPVSYRLR